MKRPNRPNASEMSELSLAKASETVRESFRTRTVGRSSDSDGGFGRKSTSHQIRETYSKGRYGQL